jgi:hypothetical protein
MSDDERIAHLKGSSSLAAKCGTTDASIVTNWVMGATYREIYVPADALRRADRICERCQDEALHDESGSDDELSPLDEDDDTSEPVDHDDPAFAEISDQRLLRELARRLGEAALTEEEGDEPKDNRD